MIFQWNLRSFFFASPFDDLQKKLRAFDLRSRERQALRLQEFRGVLPLMDLSSLWVKSCYFAAGALYCAFPPADDYSKSRLCRTGGN